MSDEPSSNSSPDPTASNEDLASASAAQLLKRRFRRPEDIQDFETTDDEVALLSAALDSALRRRQTTAEQPPPTRSRIKRLLARGDSPAGEAAAPAAGDEKTPAPERAENPAATIPAVTFTPRGARIPRARQWSWQPLGRALLYFALVAIAAAAGYSVGRHDAPPPAPFAIAKSPSVVTPTPGASNLPIEWAKALDADHAGDLATALKITEDAESRQDLGAFIAAYRDTLRTRLGYFNDVDSDLSRWIHVGMAPEVSAPINTARAFNYVRRRQFDAAAQCFDAVAQANPLDVQNLTRWGETLRRLGSLTQAADKFRLALNRLPPISPEVDAQREYLAYELRLTYVEEGRETDFDPELRAHLSGSNPTGYWLLTSAANLLQKGDAAGAADALQKARASLPADQYLALTNDYFFRTYAERPELSALLPSPSIEEKTARRSSMEYFLDP